MPRSPFFKNVARRKSSGNVLEFEPDSTAPAQSSFRVLERPEKVNRNSESQDARPKHKFNVVRPFNSPLQQIRGGKSADDLGLSANRGSGGTTNSGSSGYYDSSAASARHSSSSTLPSSLEQEPDPAEEELFPRKAKTAPMLHAASPHAESPVPPPPSFTARAARAFSFGNRHSQQAPAHKDLPPIPPIPLNGAPNGSEEPHSPQRERAMTTSSYASTAVPAKPEANLTLANPHFDSDDDFGNMFDNFGKSTPKNRPTPPPPGPSGFHRTESEPMFPPKSYARQALTPSPGPLRNSQEDAGSPYASDGPNEEDGLFSHSNRNSLKVDQGPPVPAHKKGIASAFLAGSKGAYSRVPPDRSYSPGLERDLSERNLRGMAGQEKALNDLKSPTEDDEADKHITRVELHDGPAFSETGSNRSYRAAGSPAVPNRKPVAETQAKMGAARFEATSPVSEEGSMFTSNSTTPKAAKLTVNVFSDEPLFDVSPNGPASRAIKPNHARTDSGTPKRMTKAQFEKMRRYGDSSQEASEDEAHDDEDDYEDEDEIERAKRITKQRRKQEANMTVYRQQMKKVTGGGPSDLPNPTRPSLDKSTSAPAAAMAGLHLGGLGGTPPSEAARGKPDEDDDEDVPLGILQAHGFPSSSRPPTRMAENEQARRMSVAGSVVNGGAGQGNLPPFARRLPADPYFGASLVNPAARESLAMGGAGSVYGGPAAMQPQPAQPPGGLVGVIAGEERARAARRGSPNPATGTYGPAMPLPSNMPQPMPGMPGMPRTMSMTNIAAPQTYMPSGFGMMPGMPMMTPSDQTQQQMQQFMQMQMQFMQNMMAMQQQAISASPQPQAPTTDYLGVPLPGNRPMSTASQAPSFMNQTPHATPNQGRAMTMMTPPSQWDFNTAAAAHLNGAMRPTSALPGSYAPSARGTAGGGPGPGYTPSIAPSERSTVGMPSRYRPVTMTNGDPTSSAGRSQSMTSSMTLQALHHDPMAPAQAAPDGRHEPPRPLSTIRVVDKPKGAPKVSTAPARPVDEDDEDGWLDMAKKRSEKKFGWNKKRKGKEPEAPSLPLTDPSLSDLYHDFE